MYQQTEEINLVLPTKIREIQLKRPFNYWKSICKGTWRRRTVLLRRFFVNAGRMVAIRAVRTHGVMMVSDTVELNNSMA